MKPVKIVYSMDDREKFEEECEQLINKGYYLDSTNCSCNGECSDNTYQAIFILPVSQIKESQNKSDNKQSTPLPERNCCAIHTFLPLKKDGTCESCGL